MLLGVAQIRLDGGTQPRAALNFEIVAEYREAVERGDRFPPVVVFYDGADHWCADGFHRVNAYAGAGIVEIECDVRQGTREDAVWFSCSANVGHGLRRTNADKRRAVETALRLRPDSSDRAIAEHCGVSHTNVASVRAEVTGKDCQSPRTGRDGRTTATGSDAKKAAASAKKAEPTTTGKPAARTKPDNDPPTPPPARPSPVDTPYTRAFAAVRALSPDQQRQLARTVLDILDGRIAA